MSDPSISILIPTKDRPQDLTETIRTILAQTVLPQEIVIIDQSDTEAARKEVRRLYDETEQHVRPGPRLVHIWDRTISGLTTARNRGIEAAHGGIILFLDDDVLLQPDFLAELLSAYKEHPEAAGISGVVVNYTPPSVPYRLWNSIFMRGPLFDDRQPVYWDASSHDRQSAIRVTRLGGGLMSFRADSIKQVRFDENLRGVSDGEDVDFCVRLGTGTPLFMAPTARLVHKQSPTGRDRDHWLRRHARGMVYLCKRNWSRGFRNRACVVWLYVGYTLVAALASAHRLSLRPWRALLNGRREGIAAAGQPS